jgi:hypothetical protein
MSPRVPTLLIALGLTLGAGGSAASVAVAQTTPTPTPIPAPAATAAPEATATPAPNPDPPKATTLGAESLSRTGATITGNVVPGGAEATYQFEYGTSTSYGLKTSSTKLPAGADAVAVKKAISRLTTETTYHYRLIVTNSAGTSRGSDRTLKTTANPKKPSVSTQAPINVAAQSATFVARVNPSGQETTYSFQFGLTSKLGTTSAVQSAGAGTSTVTVNTNVAGLTANAKYYFRVVAKNATGTTYGSTRTFTTPRGLTGVNATATPSPVVWSQNAVIAGTVGGAGVGGVGVALMRQDFPFTAPFQQVATQTASSAGAFSFTVGPLYQAARFQVMSQTTVPVISPTLSVQSALFTKIKIRKPKRASVEIYGLIYPITSKARVSIQRKTPKGRWVRVKRIGVKNLSDRSRFRTTVPRISRKSIYRAVVSPRDGDAHVSTVTKTVTVGKRK